MEVEAGGGVQVGAEGSAAQGWVQARAPAWARSSCPWGGAASRTRPFHPRFSFKGKEAVGQRV